MKALFPTLVIGAIAADYILTGTTSPHEQERPEYSVSVTEAGHGGGGDIHQSSVDDSRPVVVEVNDDHPDPGKHFGNADRPALGVGGMATVAKPAAGAPEGMSLSRPELAGKIDSGVEHLDKGVRELPGYVADYAKNIEKHGLKGFYYDDPALKQKGNAIGEAIGTGIRNLASAMAADMTASANESMGRK